MISSTTILVQDIEKVCDGSPSQTEILAKAKKDYYHEFKGEPTFPISRLIADCRNCGLNSIADNAMNGKYDATASEGEMWMNQDDWEALKNGVIVDQNQN